MLSRNQRRRVALNKSRRKDCSQVKEEGLLSRNQGGRVALKKLRMKGWTQEVKEEGWVLS